MIYKEITINGQQIKLISLGECACGCGGKTTIALATSKRDSLIKGVPKKFIHGHNSKGSFHYHWKGGRYIDAMGYPTIYDPLNPKSTKNRIREHTAIVEKIMGKSLPLGAVVHHHTPTQLVVCQDQGYHNLLHQRTRALKACGNPHWRKCTYCKNYDDPINLIQNNTANYHRSCVNDYNRKLRLNNLHNPRNLSQVG